MQLSKLKKIDLKEAWEGENIDFTNWLAEVENLKTLSDEIGIDISLIKTKLSMGNFNIDIYAEDKGSGRKIVIENQLEPTNNKHLGKMLTNASGFNADIIIWVVEKMQDEHKQVINWLNKNTDKKINFFIVEVEAWQIEDSHFALNLKVVVKPNSLENKEDEQSENESSSFDIKNFQLEFWRKFQEYAQKNGSNLKLGEAQSQHWHNIDFGFTNAYILLTINNHSSQITCEVYIANSKELFDCLLDKKDEIENELSERLLWEELPEKKGSRIKLMNITEISTKDNWEHYYSWMLEKATHFQEVFSKYIKECEEPKEDK